MNQNLKRNDNGITVPASTLVTKSETQNKEINNN